MKRRKPGPKQTMTKPVRLNFVTEAADAEEARAYAIAQRIPMSAIVRQALRQLLISKKGKS